MQNKYRLIHALGLSIAHTKKINKKSIWKTNFKMTYTLGLNSAQKGLIIFFDTKFNLKKKKKIKKIDFLYTLGWISANKEAGHRDLKYIKRENITHG